MEVREAHANMGSSKFRQRLTSTAARMPAKLARAVRAIHVESESSRSEADSGGSDTDSDRHNVYMAAAADRDQKTGDPIVQNDRFDQETLRSWKVANSVYTLWVEETLRSRMLEATDVSEVRT